MKETLYMHAMFLDDLAVEFLFQPDRRSWFRKLFFSRERKVRLLKRFRFYDGRGHTWEADPGMESNGASIPQLLWHVIGHPFGEMLEAGVIHDMLYTQAKVSRKEADMIFRAGLQASGISEVKIFLAYWALRLFAASRYNRA